jgi:hypothetical protein
VFSPANLNLQIQGGNQGGAGGGVIQSRDSRIFNPDVSTAGAIASLSLGQGSNAALPGNLCHDLPANAYIRVQTVLGPRNGGANITAWGTVVNTAFSFSVLGYLRRFETSDGF